jgi:hypothetical protein
MQRREFEFEAFHLFILKDKLLTTILFEKKNSNVRNNYKS